MRAGPLLPRLRAALRRRTGLPIAEAMPSLVLLGVMWLGIALCLHQARTDALATARADIAVTAEAAEAGVTQAIALADQTLRALCAAAEAAPQGRLDLVAWRRARFGDFAGFRLRLFGADGNLLDSTGPNSTGNNSTGPNTTGPAAPDARWPATKLPDGDQLLIAGSDPGRDPLSLHFVHRLTAGPARLAILSVEPAWLSRAYASLDGGRGFFLLAGADGRVLSSAPAAAAPIGTAAVGPDGRTLATIDGIAREVELRPVSHLKLTVAFGRETDRILAGVTDLTLRLLLLGAGLSLLVLLAAGLVARHRRQLLAAGEELADVIEHLGQGVVLTDAAGHISLVNRRAVELCHATLSAPAAPETIEERAGTDGRRLEIRTRALAGGGTVRTVAALGPPPAGEDDIRELAFVDALTGLANRRRVEEQVTAALAEAQRGGPPVGLILLDLDRFKAVNDTLGHAAGDALLKTVAGRLRTTTGAADLIARLGGDEFIVMQAGPPQPAASLALAERLVGAVSEPYDLGGQPVSVGTSAGVAVPAVGDTFDRLIGNADFALYAAKGAGRGMVRLFDNAMRAELSDRRELVADLRAAIAAGEIDVHYQPIFAAATGEAVAFEALARWTHPVHGRVPPARFIPLAEAHGLIQPLGQHVLARACATAAGWPSRFRLVANLSPHQIGVGNLARMVGDTLAESGLSAERLELEIPERALIERTEEALAVFRGLRSLGARVSLDDFGTGYSGLATLNLFPFDRIKIDGALVRALDGDRATGTIVQAIIGMGRTMQIAMAADGVENEVQLAILRQQRCSEVQGHFLAHPGPAETLGRFMAGSAPRPASRPLPGQPAEHRVPYHRVGARVA